MTKVSTPDETTSTSFLVVMVTSDVTVPLCDPNSFSKVIPGKFITSEDLELRGGDLPLSFKLPPPRVGEELFDNVLDILGGDFALTGDLELVRFTNFEGLETSQDDQPC